MRVLLFVSITISLEEELRATFSFKIYVFIFDINFVLLFVRTKRGL